MQLDEDEIPYAFTVPAKDVSRTFELLNRNRIVTNKPKQGKVSVDMTVELVSKVRPGGTKLKFNRLNRQDAILEAVYTLSHYKQKHGENVSLKVVSEATGIELNVLKHADNKYF